MTAAARSCRSHPTIATSRPKDRRAKPPPSGGKPPPGSERMPVAAALELARWGFARLRALVADFPEEVSAIDRVASATEASIRAGCACPLADVPEADLLTTASILITAADPDNGVAEAIGVALDVMSHGAQCERTPTAMHAPPTVQRRRNGAHRPPLVVHHLRLVP